MNKFKLGTKIGIGYALILLVMVLLGGITWWKMDGVQQRSGILVDEYAPSLNKTNAIRNSATRAMYHMREFTLTTDDRYLQEAREEIEDLSERIDAARELTAEAEHLETLGEEVLAMDSQLDRYQGLVDESARLSTTIAEKRTTMLTAGDRAEELLVSLSEAQRSRLDQELADIGAGQAIADRVAKVRLLDAIATGLDRARTENWKAQAERNPEVVAQAAAELLSLQDQVKELADSLVVPDEQRQAKTIGESLGRYAAAMRSYADDQLALRAVGDQRTQAGNAIVAAVGSSADAAVSNTQEIAGQAQADLGAAIMVTIVGLLVALAAGVTLALAITRSITKPIRVSIASLDEGSEQVMAASSQISQSSQSVAEGASEQASSLEETSASLEEITAAIRHNADNAREANGLAREARDTTGKGEERSKAILAEVNERLAQLQGSVKSIRTSTEQTAKVVDAIDEIAFQTNLLALNAAVEAARAGDAGAGFAVVADEVRSLAQRSAEEVRNTANLIEGARKSAADMEEVSTEVERYLQETMEREMVVLFTEANGSTSKVSQLMAEVSASCDEQARGIDQINEAVAQIDQVTQSNAAASEESAAGSEELNAQATELKRIVASLAALVHGGSAHDHHATQAPVRPAVAEPKRHNGHNGHNGQAVALKRPPLRTNGHATNGSAAARKGSVNGNGHTNGAVDRVASPAEVLPLGDEEVFRDF